MKTTLTTLCLWSIKAAFFCLPLLCITAQDNTPDAALVTSGTASISGKVWQEAEPDVNHIFDISIDQVLKGIPVNLLDAHGLALDHTETDTLGCYRFDSLATGSYQVMFMIPDNLSFVHPNVSGDPAIDSGVTDIINGKTDVLFIRDNEELPFVNAGLRFKTLATENVDLKTSWSKIEGTALLQWAYDQSMIPDRILIYRSSGEQSSLELLAELIVSGDGLSSMPTTYSDTDVFEAGHYYYRIVIEGADGNRISSEIMALTVDAILSEVSPLITYPNPVTGEVVAAVTLDERADVSFRLIDTQGKVVHIWKKQFLEPGRNLLRLQIPEAPSGQYILYAQIGSRSFKQLMVIK